jgi:hypothetical protein
MPPVTKDAPIRLLSRLICTLAGHRPRGGQATFDEADGRFVDVAKTQYAVCTRCGDVRPAPLTVVDEDADSDGEDTVDADDRDDTAARTDAPDDPDADAARTDETDTTAIAADAR